MMDPSKTRIGGSKVRTGCRTCKARRVKCDETKPECLRCVKSKRRCDGYSPSPEPAPIAPGHKFVHYVEPSQVLSLSRSPSPRPSLDSPALRALDFFAHSTALQLERPFSIDLWAGALSCFMQQQPAIQHAVIALASLHENFLNPAGPLVQEQRRVLALEHYGKSIQQVVYANQRESNGAVMTTLISCLLFSAIESVQRHVLSARKHINAGLGLLLEHESRLLDEEQSGLGMPIGFIRSIGRLFVSLGSQMVSLEDHLTDPAVMDYLVGSPDPGYSPLESTEQALAKLAQITNDSMRFLTWGEGFDDQEEGPAKQAYYIVGEQLQTRFDNWTAAFHDLFAESPGVDQYSSYTAIRLLRLNSLACRIFLAMKYERSQTGYDKYLDEFKALVQAAEEYLEAMRAAPESVEGHVITSLNRRENSQPRIFSLTNGIIPGLFFTCRSCRDSVTRRRALALLKSSKRRESIWDSEAASVVAERVIELEEDRAKHESLPDGGGMQGQDSQAITMADLPESARIRALHIEFSTDEDAAHISMDDRSGERKPLEYVGWRDEM